MKIRFFCIILMMLAIIEAIIAIFVCNEAFSAVLDVIISINCIKFIRAIPMGYKMEKIDYAEVGLLVVLLIFVGNTLYEALF